MLTREDGMPDTTRMSAIVDQIARLHANGIQVILISSGAVATGRTLISNPQHLDSVSARQLYSAVGQVRLMSRYYDLFGQWNITCGQVLTTKESLSTRQDYLNQRNCMEVMLTSGVVPIVNENDTISVTELMFTDNDELSGLVCTMMGADALIILSNIDGIYDGVPSEPTSKVIRTVECGQSLEQYIQTTRSTRGRGGMGTKSRISQKVASEGIEVIIANGTRDNILTDLVLDCKDVVCTRFEPSAKVASGVKKWIAHSEGFAKGTLVLNEGACSAILENRAASILPVGVVSIEGDFERDDIVRIVDQQGRHLGVGRVAMDSHEVQSLMGVHGQKPVVHYDYMYLD